MSPCYEDRGAPLKPKPGGHLNNAIFPPEMVPGWIDTDFLQFSERTHFPKVFTRIHMHFVVKGRGVAPEKVERAIALSVEKYCSASAMIAKTATITHDFEVVDTRATAGGMR